MKSEVLPKNGLLPICLTEDNLLPLEIQILKLQLYLVVYHKSQFLVHFFFFNKHKGFQQLLRYFRPAFVLQMTQIYFLSHKNLSQLELIVNNKLMHVHTWLCTNKLSLNIVKSSFCSFFILRNENWSFY